MSGDGVDRLAGAASTGGSSFVWPSVCVVSKVLLGSSVWLTTVTSLSGSTPCCTGSCCCVNGSCICSPTGPSFVASPISATTVTSLSGSPPCCTGSCCCCNESCICSPTGPSLVGSPIPVP